MKKLICFLVILVAGYWLYGKCSHDDSQAQDVMKQVRVTAQTANLRTGPGTSHEVALTAAGGKWQVSRGAVLDVVGQEDGWYEVRLDGDATRTRGGGDGRDGIGGIDCHKNPLF